ncbi:MAG: (Fe-S)-binding protein [Chloroflexi bacterium]|nr:(Fe-S)-binding protein [Chloroflexota bacterium]
MEQTEQTTKDQIYIIDDAKWDELIEITHGAAAVCYQCGVCTATCPWGIVKDETVSVRKFMRQAQLGIDNGSEQLWLCTTCAQCDASCPRGVVISDVFRGLRQVAWDHGKPEEGLPSVLWSVFWNQNPWSQAPSQRFAWAKDLDLPSFDPENHEILFYVGCTASFDKRAQKVSRSLVQILNAAGISFGVLGDDEPCCGESVLNVGHKPYFLEIVDETMKVFQERGVTKFLTVSPHCYDVFKNHYPQMDGFEPVHYTQYLAVLIDEGRLKFEKKLKHKVTFQDPCYLARHNNESQAPRKVLGAIPGITLEEMENNASDTLCCGGGGGRMFLETAAGERFSDLRVDDALYTKADILVTACPACISCLEDSVKSKKLKDFAVMDVAELGAQALRAK